MLPVDVLESSVDMARTRLDDLQAELEAAARCAERIHEGATTLDSRVVAHGRRLAEFRAIMQRIVELRASIQEQRLLRRDLRASMNRVRRSARELRRQPDDSRR